MLHNKVGEPGRPIIVGGHGLTLEGRDPLRIDEWREVSPGLCKCAALFDKVFRLDMAVIDRWFLVFDGRMQLMNRSSKGPPQPLKQSDQLLPGEWTFVKDEVRSPVFDQAKYREQIDGDFFIRLALGGASRRCPHLRANPFERRDTRWRQQPCRGQEPDLDACLQRRLHHSRQDARVPIREHCSHQVWRRWLQCSRTIASAGSTASRRSATRPACVTLVTA